jgi:hypothetical protein
MGCMGIMGGMEIMRIRAPAGRRRSGEIFLGRALSGGTVFDRLPNHA